MRFPTVASLVAVLVVAATATCNCWERVGNLGVGGLLSQAAVHCSFEQHPLPIARTLVKRRGGFIFSREGSKSENRLGGQI